MCCLLLATALLVAGPSATAPPGVVVAFNPARTKEYIGSPGLAVLPNGEYVASHDFFRAGDHGDVTVVYASADKGKTWAKRATVKGQWWSSLFVHRGDLYLMGTSGARGFCVIRRSKDGGKTWTEPKDADTGLLLGDGMYHCAPMPVLEHNGRLWRGMEDGSGPKGWDRKFKAFMMSAPVEADLLKARSWTCSNRLAHNSDWLGGKFGGWLEGNAVATPNGEVVDILRVQQPDYPEVAAMVRISADGKTATFDPAKDFLPFPGGGKKFTIRFDKESKKYWALANHVPKEFEGPRAASRRNTLALISSPDLRAWAVERVVLQHPDVKAHGFQYADWLFDGDDIIALVRTAWDEPDGTPAHNAHDANHLTFHRISAFRGGRELGKLSEKYESGNNGPATVSTGKGDPGGVSYGTYQLASKVGSADRFVQRYYPDEFKGLKGGTPEFTAKWKALAKKDPAGLRANEHAYIKATHYDPQAAKLREDLGLDVAKRSAALRDVVWSTAVQHGGRTDVIVTAVKPLLKGKPIAEVTDEAIIRAVYAERGRKTPDGKLARFRRVSDDWIPGLTRRFENELKDALALLRKE